MSRGLGRGLSTMVRIRPGLAESTTMRSAMKATSWMSWLTMRIDEGLRSWSAQMSSTSARRPSAVRASTALKGSSMNRISGSTDRARAMPTRCFMPPDSSRGYASSNPSRPTIWMAAWVRSLDLGLVHALGAQHALHVGLHRHPGVEGEALEHDGDAVQETLMVLAVVEDLALAGLDEAGDDAHDGGLAACRTARSVQTNSFRLMLRLMSASTRRGGPLPRSKDLLDAPQFEDDLAIGPPGGKDGLGGRAGLHPEGSAVGAGVVHGCLTCRGYSG